MTIQRFRCPVCGIEYDQEVEKVEERWMYVIKMALQVCQECRLKVMALEESRSGPATHS